jgi:hypothetical protein
MLCHFKELIDHEPPKMSPKYGAGNTLECNVQEGASDLIFNGRPAVLREVVDKQNSGREVREGSQSQLLNPVPFLCSKGKRNRVRVTERKQVTLSTQERRLGGVQVPPKPASPNTSVRVSSNDSVLLEIESLKHTKRPYITRYLEKRANGFHN